MRESFQYIAHRNPIIKSDQNIRSPILSLNTRSHDELKSLSYFKDIHKNQIQATQHRKPLQVELSHVVVWLRGGKERECGRAQSSKSSFLP